jgi:hypothetical protein
MREWRRCVFYVCSKVESDLILRGRSISPPSKMAGPSNISAFAREHGAVGSVVFILPMNAMRHNSVMRIPAGIIQ